MQQYLIYHSLGSRIMRINIRRLGTAIVSLSNKKPDDIEIPPEPTTCCMSGCANCVWIGYAEELSKLYEGNGDKAREIILNKINDPNLKMFLSIELKYIQAKDKDDKKVE